MLVRKEEVKWKETLSNFAKTFVQRETDAPHDIAVLDILSSWL